MFLNAGWARRGDSQRAFRAALLFPAEPTPRQIQINAIIDGAVFAVALAWLLPLAMAVPIRVAAGLVRIELGRWGQVDRTRDRCAAS